MICNKCGIDGNFTWDQNWFDNTGQWRIFDLNMERPHDCPGMKTEASITEPILDRPLVKCPQCDPLNQTRKASGAHQDRTLRFLVVFTPRFSTKNSLFW